ncbi:MAG: hypothetical protein V1837_07945 [Candidatus Woesearchaeota archaeon]
MLNVKRKLGRFVGRVGLLCTLYNTSHVLAETTFSGIPQVTYDDKEAGLRVKLKQSYNKTGNKQAGDLEFLVGTDIGKYIQEKDLKLIIYADVKTDLKDTVHLGAAFEADQRIAKFLHLGLKANQYFGLDKKSKEHISYNPYLMVDLTNKLSFGAWDLGKYAYKDRTGFDYIGPFAMYSITKNICIIGHYGIDVHNKDNRLLYLKVDFNFGKLDDKKQEEKGKGK